MRSNFVGGVSHDRVTSTAMTGGDDDLANATANATDGGPASTSLSTATSTATATGGAMRGDGDDDDHRHHHLRHRVVVDDVAHRHPQQRRLYAACNLLHHRHLYADVSSASASASASTRSARPDADGRHPAPGPRRGRRGRRRRRQRAWIACGCALDTPWDENATVCELKNTSHTAASDARDAPASGWKRDLHNAIIFSDIRRHFISFGKVRKEICINLPTTKIALDDGCARRKTRKTNETTRQLLRYFCRSGLEVARPDDGALAFTRFYVQTVLWHGHFCLKYAPARNGARDTHARAEMVTTAFGTMMERSGAEKRARWHIRDASRGAPTNLFSQRKTAKLIGRLTQDLCH